MWDNFYNTKNYLEKKNIIKAKKKKILIENINILGNLSEKKCMSSEQCVGYALGRLYFHVHGNDKNKKSVKKKKKNRKLFHSCSSLWICDRQLIINIIISPLRFSAKELQQFGPLLFFFCPSWFSS